MPRETVKREGEGIEIESSSRRHCKGVLLGNVLENREGKRSKYIKREDPLGVEIEESVCGRGGRSITRKSGEEGIGIKMCRKESVEL